MKRVSWIVLILGVMLAGSAGAVEFSADMVTQISGRSNTGKIYFKNPSLFRNEVMGIIIINKRPKVYQLFPDSKKYVVSDVNELKKQNPMAGVENYEEWLNKNHMQKQGSETIQGYACDIYKGKVKLVNDQPPINMQVWYSKQLGYPLKSISKLPAPMGEVSNQLQNIQTGSQPDRLFQIPAGYQKAASVQEAMGMGGFNMQGGGQPPSEEDMQKIMKKMMKQKPAQ